MRPLELLLIACNLAAWVALVVSPAGAARWVHLAAPAAALVALAQVLAEGSRWQLVPAYALSGLLLLAWLVRLLAPLEAPHRLAGGVAAGLGALGLVVAAALPLVLPVFRLPRPTGPHAIGTLTYHWVDDARAELFTPDPTGRRELVVQVWYPARARAPSSPRAPYVPDPGALAPLARMLHLPGFLFGHFRYVETSATPAAPAAAGEAAFPVLIFSAGRGGFRQESTHLFEELVSHGYVVASIDHPYASSGVAFPDGRLVTLAARLLPGPQGGFPADRRFLDDVAVPFLAGDVRFTLDRLTALNEGDPNGILTGKLDLQRAGMLGPSLGGLVGAEACRLEPRLRAFLAMDVHMPASVVRAGLEQPTMFISREARWMELEGWSREAIDETQATLRAVHEELPGDAYLVLVPGMFHLDFSDAPLYSPVTRWLGLTGPIGGARAIGIVDAFTLGFFDRHLKGLPVRLLEEPSEAFPEVVFSARHPAG